MTDARQMHMEWHTDTGEVRFNYPSNLTVQDAADIRALIGVAFLGIDRRASAIEARRAETGTGSVEDESAPGRPDPVEQPDAPKVSE